jgi:DNA-directed RNA polymerase subunit omega
MARITVEDCIEKVDNRFSLVLLAAKRARQLMKGSKFLLPATDNKYVVNALREIAAGKVWIRRDEPKPEENADR